MGWTGKPCCSAYHEAVGKNLTGTMILAAKQKGGHIVLSIRDGAAGMALVKTCSGPE